MRLSKLGSLAISFVLLLYFLFLIDLNQLRSQLVFYNFQSRDLGRALELLQGHWIFYGPEMTGGGNLPGPFYYVLLAGILAFVPTWIAAWWGMILLAAAGVIGAWLFISRRQGVLAAFLWISLFIDSVQTQHILSIFMNPSYLLGFAMVLLLLAIATFAAAKPETRSWAFWGLGFLTGLAIQIHLSALFIFAAVLFMQNFARAFDLPNLGRRQFWLGIFWFFIPLLPFAFGERPYSGQALSVWPTYLYLIHATNQANLWRVIWVQSLKAIPWSLPLIALVAVLFRAPAQRLSVAARVLLVCVAFGFIPFCYVYVVPIANRYSIPFYLPLIFLTVVAHREFLHTRMSLWIFNGLSAVALIGLWVWSEREFPGNAGEIDWPRFALAAVAGLAASYYWERQLENKLPKYVAYLLILALSQFQGFAFAQNEISLIQSNMAKSRQWNKIWSRIECATQWPYDKARERVYFVNGHIDEDPHAGFTSAEDQLSPHDCSRETPDGFFVAVNIPDGVDFKAWLLAAPIAEDVKTALRLGEIEVGSVEQGRTSIASYRVKSTAHVPRHFHDVGLSYEASPELDIFGKIDDLEGVREVEEHTYLFKWNECPEHHPDCTYGALLTLKGKKLNVRVIGASLSQVSPWVHPTWTQALDKPYVEVMCDGVRERFLMAQAIGFKRENLYFEPITNYFVANNSLVAPFEREFEIACEKPETLTFGREASTVDRLRDSIKLPGNKLSLQP
jgi:hypothetical protein